MQRSREKSMIVKDVLLLLMACILTLSLAACGQQQPSGNEQKGDKNPVEEDKIYEGKIQETKDYLLNYGIIPLEPVTQAAAGDERTITWDNLANRPEIQLLDAFLNDSLQKASEKIGYGSVALRVVTFNIENQQVAEVYFHEDKIVGGVTYPAQEIAQEKRNYRNLEGKTLAQIRQIDYPLWQPGQTQPSEPSLFYLQTEQAQKDGFENAIQILNLGQGKNLIVFRNDLEIRAYVHDLITGSDFYTGISTKEEYLPIRVKLLEENRMAVMLQEEILIVNREDFKTIKEMPYPEQELTPNDIDITPDGKTIVLAGKKGITVYDGNFENGKLIVPSQIGSDPHGMDTQAPRGPVFSPDSSHILYRMFGYEWLVGTGTIEVSGSDHRFFLADQEETNYIKWFDNTHIYSNGPSYAEYDNPVIRNIQTAQETYLVKDAPKDKYIRYFKGDDRKLYALETVLDESYNLKTARLSYYDLEKGTWHSLMENNALRHLDWYLSAYDAQEDVFVFTLSNHPLSAKATLLAGLKAE
ncbi:hypothetical protein Desdi_3353 [Desulfitobacterium dichloroeliminans LMG P-21439]|uniref:Periplasmic component of the Tol biopolymer transport system n=1 Tax=Desulfitobacterium dichloroeliminans (strain LMG P-21439 / DCA1) TaxID=871963 RepID=L0FCK5_DESDL|nr:hypothetical protein [Desulfitobacterium dichloroeliminans]AGA70745.1 hypothetical protein Desdi_3353 [Desulfitobacterium dichloroeliminans LMG P-21439]